MGKLLIVVDYQKDFVDGSLGFAGAEKLEQPILDKIAAYRRAGDTVAFTFDTHGEDYLSTQEGRRLPVPHTLKDTAGWALYGKVADARRPEDPCFFKPAFGSAALFDYLREHPFESIELVGLVSSICVISNAVLAKAAQPETPVSVDAGCTAGGDRHLHEAALDVMTELQIDVIRR
ncbi:MAG: cysteine hydrolase family protein [Acutalibacteraceae bacterium]|jgi:nicotinamidase/pyrazinamidase